MILYDSRAANAPSPRMRRAKTPFARCPCTKPAICAGAVNHPHHINPMNHSSDKCQRTLVHALTPVNPFHPPPKGLQPNPYPPGATTRAAFASHQSAVMRRKLFCPISRKLSYISRTCAPACATPSTAAERLPARPVPAQPTTRAAFASHQSAVMRRKLFCPISRKLSYISRTCAPACQPLQPPQKGLQRGPCAATASAVLRPKFLAQSHTISRNLP